MTTRAGFAAGAGVHESAVQVAIKKRCHFEAALLTGFGAAAYIRADVYAMMHNEHGRHGRHDDMTDRT